MSRSNSIDSLMGESPNRLDGDEELHDELNLFDDLKSKKSAFSKRQREMAKAYGGSP
jgi:hypothetical protein